MVTRHDHDRLFGHDVIPTIAFFLTLPRFSTPPTSWDMVGGAHRFSVDQRWLTSSRSSLRMQTAPEASAVSRLGKPDVTRTNCIGKLAPIENQLADFVKHMPKMATTYPQLGYQGKPLSQRTIKDYASRLGRLFRVVLDHKEDLGVDVKTCDDFLELGRRDSDQTDGFSFEELLKFVSHDEYSAHFFVDARAAMSKFVCWYELWSSTTQLEASSFGSGSASASSDGSGSGVAPPKRPRYSAPEMHGQSHAADLGTAATMDTDAAAPPRRDNGKAAVGSDHDGDY